MAAGFGSHADPLPAQPLAHASAGKVVIMLSRSPHQGGGIGKGAKNAGVTTVTVGAWRVIIATAWRVTVGAWRVIPAGVILRIVRLFVSAT